MPLARPRAREKLSLATMSVWHIGVAVVETAKISIPTVFESALGRVRTDVCDRRLDSWSERILRQVNVKLAVHEHEHVGHGETFVVMSNHQSLYDIPVLFQALKRPMRMVAKRELFRIPIWAQAMRASGFVEVDRGNRAQAIASLNAAKETMRGGINLWIAPEGTRSRTGVLGSFKRGGFHLALQTGARILPVTIVGSRDILVADSKKIRRGAEVDVTFSAPVDPKEYGAEGRRELADEVRRRIAAHLPEALRGE